MSDGFTDGTSVDQDDLAALVGALRAHLEWAAATGVREWPVSPAALAPPAAAEVAARPAGFAAPSSPVARPGGPPPAARPGGPSPVATPAASARPGAPSPIPTPASTARSGGPPPVAQPLSSARHDSPLPASQDAPRTPASRRLTAPLRPDGQGPDSLALIAADIGHACTRCARATSREPILHGTGRAGARVLVLGLEPAAPDAVASEPFTGIPGRLLTRMLRAIGLGREEAFLTHLVKCRTIPSRAPTPDELAACGGFLARQLRVVAPRAVLALGPEAGALALGRHEPRGMPALRAATGTFHGVPLIVTWHPTQLLAEPRLKAEAWQDLRRLRSLVG
jgi:uracil-DNA glycosylase family 4